MARRTGREFADFLQGYLLRDEQVPGRPQLIGVSDLAKACGVTARTVSRWLRSASLPADIDAIETGLFGDDLNRYDIERLLLKKAYESDRASWHPSFPGADITGYEKSLSPALALLDLKHEQPGHKWKLEDGHMAIDPSGDETDADAANDPIVHQLHDAVRRHANAFLAFAVRLDNAIGWQGLSAATSLLLEHIKCDTAELPDHLGYIWDAAVEIGSFLEQDNGLRSSRSSNADPLEPEARRALETLVRTAAPWVRRFPTARDLDDEAGAFLARPELFEPAAAVFDRAQAQTLITDADRRSLQTLFDVARRGGLQARKAGNRFIATARSLILCTATFHLGMAGNIAAEKSPIAHKIAETYLDTETEILRLFENEPADIRLAISDILTRFSTGRFVPGILPAPPVLSWREPEEDWHSDPPRITSGIVSLRTPYPEPTGNGYLLMVETVFTTQGKRLLMGSDLPFIEIKGEGFLFGGLADGQVTGERFRIQVRGTELEAGAGVTHYGFHVVQRARPRSLTESITVSVGMALSDPRSVTRHQRLIVRGTQMEDGNLVFARNRLWRIRR